jgi:hypothetical protein
MSFFDSLRIISRLAAAAVLLVVAGAGSDMRPGSAVDSGLPGSPTRTQPGKPASRPARAAATPRLQNFARSPLSFEANQSQTDPQVQYLSRGPGYTRFLTATVTVNPGP